MPRRIAVSTLNASTIDILNVIRQNASLEYQSLVPEVTQATDIPKVGAVLMGYPAMANQFINALVNRIAIVRVNSATFNNPYVDLKKGYLEFGETVEQIFVGIKKALVYDPEKGEEREFKRYLPDVQTSFHVVNWRVLYPVTIENDMLKEAFLSLDGVTDLIARIVDSVYTAANYDEFLLFKYMLIKSITKGEMFPVEIDASDIKNTAIAFRGTSNVLPFMSSKYNYAHVANTTPKERQQIFMDAFFNAQYDVNILASAFNMDRADFMGRLHLIDDFTTFDNDRFDIIRSQSDGLEAVTSAELSAMANVVGVLVDEDWFQVYDNLNQFTEKYVASGLRWNYFYHVWKTISSSPFHNAVVFIKGTGVTDIPTALVYTITDIDTDASGNKTVSFALKSATGADTFTDMNFIFQNTDETAAAGIAVQPYGALIIPAAFTDDDTVDVTVKATAGATYTKALQVNADTTSSPNVPSDLVVGADITFTKDA